MLNGVTRTWKTLLASVKQGCKVSLDKLAYSSGFILASFNMKPYSHHKMKVLVET